MAEIFPFRAYRYNVAHVDPAKVLTQPCRAPMALADGRLYLRDDQKLLCLDVKKK